MKSKFSFCSISVQPIIFGVATFVTLSAGCTSRTSQKATSDQSALKNPFDRRAVVQKLTQPCVTGAMGKGLVQECKVANETTEIETAAKQAVFAVTEAQKADSKISPAALFKRDVHPKHHACVKGTFRISDTVAPEYNAGIFADAGRSYPIWSRISNSGLTPQTSDEAGDFRGITFKLLGVPGKKLLSGAEGSQNLDFLFVNIPFFVAKDLKEYNAQLSFKQGPNLGNIIEAGLKTRLLALTSKALGMSKMINPLNETYFSITSFQLGDNSVRYRAVPCESKRTLGNEGKSGENKFREALSATLSRENGCFLIQARRLLVPSWQLNEDVTKTWEEHVADAMPETFSSASEADKQAEYAQIFSEWSQVASVDIPMQAFEKPAQQTFCENTSFNVWRTVADMKPLGNLNRARQMVYSEVAKARRQGNKVSEAEPTGLEKFED